MGSPRKWMVEEEKERERTTLARKNLDDILSSDDDQVTEKKVSVRPRQRSFKRRTKQEFTNELTPDQLVRMRTLISSTTLVMLRCVCVFSFVRPIFPSNREQTKWCSPSPPSTRFVCMYVVRIKNQY